MGKAKTVVTVISKISERAVASGSALVVIYGTDLGRKYDLDQKTTVIGRSSTCDILVDQDSISRNHAKITIEDGKATIEDMGSTNGTFVNDESVANGLQLRNGDLIKIGRTIFKYIGGGNIEAQYHEEIYKLTTTDGLTQIFNKRYFKETLEREVSRCLRYKRNLSLLMFDIDHFKAINDTYGHLAGDYVLKHLAQTVHSRIRREDVFARYGGEEFAIILPEVDLEGTVATAEKIRKIVETERFEFDERQIPLTISLGAAAMGAETEDTERLIKAADVKLYEAKQGGRNRVCS